MYACNVLWPWCKNITKKIRTTETQSKPNEKGPPHVVEWLLLKDKMMGNPGVHDETTYGINHLPNARGG